MILLLALFSSFLHAEVCTFSYTIWNTKTRRSERPISVKKDRSQLAPTEKGPRGCSLCEQDQVKIHLSNGVSFRACRFFAPEFKQALENVLKSGKKIETVLSYRPSISKGKADSRGLRTEYSHHAFGAALDINENDNGLYNNCLNWSGQCVLAKGGAYRPESDLSIRDKDEFVTQMGRIGLKWGGTIAGNQKDFMHFSLDGY